MDTNCSEAFPTIGRCHACTACVQSDKQAVLTVSIKRVNFFASDLYCFQTYSKAPVSSSGREVGHSCFSSLYAQLDLSTTGLIFSSGL